MFRAALLIPMLLASQPGWSQVPWNDLKQEQRWRKGFDGQFRLFFTTFPPRQGQAWNLTEDGTRLVVSGAMTFQVLGEKDLAALQETFPDLGRPDWFVMGPEGNLLLSGTGELDVPGLMAAFRATGWRPRWEVRAEFLRDHPEHGEARAEELAQRVALVLSRARNLNTTQSSPSDPFAGVTAEGWDKAGISQVQDALDALLRVPDWEASEYFLSNVNHLDRFRTCPQMQPSLGLLLARLKELLRQNPMDYRIWDAFRSLKPILPTGFPVTATAGLEPVPGGVGFEESVTELACDLYLRDQDWQGLERFTSERWASAAMSPDTRALALRGGIDERGVLLVSQVGIPRILALLMVGKQDEARSVLLECRNRSDSYWPVIARIVADEAKRKGAKATEGWKGLEDVLKLPAMETIPPLKPEVYRLLVGRYAASPEDLKKFQEDPRFDYWHPNELQWGSLGEAEEGLLRDLTPAGKAFQWALFKGKAVLEAGVDPPTPKALADALDRHGRPLLPELIRFLDREPGRLDARELFIDLVGAKLPNARLEADLLPRLQGWGIRPAKSGSFKPSRDQEAWAAMASRTLPRLEAGLEVWPQSTRLWSRWLFWSQFRPNSITPAAMLAKLPHLPTAAPDASSIRPNVLNEVARTLGPRKAWKDLAAWCAAVWELDQRRYLEAILNRPAKVRSNFSDPQVEIRWVRELLLKPWEEALIQLGDTARLKRLQSELKAMGYKDPGPWPARKN